LVNFDIHNALNANPVTIVNKTYPANGVGWRTPQGILLASLCSIQRPLTVSLGRLRRAGRLDPGGRIAFGR
jgi:hypothetical protein